jgi:hypothetical protein
VVDGRRHFVVGIARAAGVVPAVLSLIEGRGEALLLSAAFVLVDEVRHMTVWRRVLGLKIY